jgi:hypothetical protein
MFLETIECRSWKVGVNFFGAQGDGRWWKDHRIPGGVAFSMNSVGHFACLRRIQTGAQESDQRHGLDQALVLAMTLINATRPGPSGRDTWLHDVSTRPEPLGASCNIALPVNLAGKNRYQYGGLYHTDQTIPSGYFTPAMERPDGPNEDLDLTYLHVDSPDNPDYLSMGLGLPQS